MSEREKSDESEEEEKPSEGNEGNEGNDGNEGNEGTPETNDDEPKTPLPPPSPLQTPSSLESLWYRMFRSSLLGLSSKGDRMSSSMVRCVGACHNDDDDCVEGVARRIRFVSCGDMNEFVRLAGLG